MYGDYSVSRTYVLNYYSTYSDALSSECFSFMLILFFFF